MNIASTEVHACVCNKRFKARKSLVHHALYCDKNPTKTGELGDYTLLINIDSEAKKIPSETKAVEVDDWLPSTTTKASTSKTRKSKKKKQQRKRKSVIKSQREKEDDAGSASTCQEDEPASDPSPRQQTSPKHHTSEEINSADSTLFSFPSSEASHNQANDDPRSAPTEEEAEEEPQASTSPSTPKTVSAGHQANDAASTEEKVEEEGNACSPQASTPPSTPKTVSAGHQANDAASTEEVEEEHNDRAPQASTSPSTPKRQAFTSPSTPKIVSAGAYYNVIYDGPLQYGLLFGGSSPIPRRILIPAPVPTIQIGSMRIPLHLPQSVHPSEPLPPIFQFGPRRYICPARRRRILPMTPPEIAFSGSDFDSRGPEDPTEVFCRLANKMTMKQQIKEAIQRLVEESISAEALMDKCQRLEAELVRVMEKCDRLEAELARVEKEKLEWAVQAAKSERQS